FWAGQLHEFHTSAMGWFRIAPYEGYARRMPYDRRSNHARRILRDPHVGNRVVWFSESGPPRNCFAWLGCFALTMTPAVELSEDLGDRGAYCGLVDAPAIFDR